MKNLNLILRTLITLVFVGMIAYMVYASWRVASSEHSAAMLRMHLESQQKQVQLLSAAVESADLELQRMRKEREKLAAIQSEYEQRIAAISKQAAELNTAVSNIEHSTDETVKSWAAVELPADAVGVLQHRTNQSGSTNQNSNAATTRQHAINGLQAASF